MARLIITTLLLASVCRVSLSYYFDHYELALQWPGSYRPSGSNDPANSGFHFADNITSWTIHGLWPSLNKTYPENCSPSCKLNLNDIYLLEDRLRASWPSYYGSDKVFWNHEWCKHGTCASNVTSLDSTYKFFNFVLALHQKYDIVNILAKSQIYPKEDQPYQLKSILKALQPYFKSGVRLGCVSGKYLADIEICLDKNFSLSCDIYKYERREIWFRIGETFEPVGDCSEHGPIWYKPIPH